MFKVLMNRTAADVVNNNDELWTVYPNLEQAQRAAIALQKNGDAIAAWVEEVE